MQINEIIVQSYNQEEKPQLKKGFNLNLKDFHNQHPDAPESANLHLDTAGTGIRQALYRNNLNNGPST